MLAGDRGLESLRRAAAAFVRAAGQGDAAAFLLPTGTDLDPGAVGDAVAEGAVLAAYRYDAYRTGDSPGRLATLVIVTDSAATRRRSGRGRRGGHGWPSRSAWPATWSTSHRARSPPSRFADTFVERFAGVAGVTVEVWDEERIVAERLGACSAWPGVRPSHPGWCGSSTGRPTPSRSTAGCPTWPWWARGSPSTRAACRSRRRPAWRP